jgi:ABC-type glycerol-3-phosphate transport system substrate-binding protein
MLSPESLFNELTTVPARKSVAERSGFWQKLPAERAAAFQAILEGPNARQLIGARTIPILYEVDFEPVLSAVASGKQTAQAALREAQRAREQAAPQPSPTPNTQPIAVATPLPEAAAAVTRIRFGAAGSNDEQLRQLAARFNQQHPDIFVQIAHRDVSRAMPPLAERAAQTDCFAAFGAPPADQISATLDLQPLIDAEGGQGGTALLDDYPPALLAPFQRAGELHGLPHEIYVRVLHYNQTAFDAAGIAHPTAAWTLDDFMLAAEQLTHGTGEARQYGFGAPFSSWRDVFFILDRFGASATAGSGATLRPNFNDPKAQQAIRYYLDLLRNYSPHARLTDYALDETEHNNDQELIDAGRVGMWFSFGLDTRSATSFTLAVAPAPLGQRVLTQRDYLASALYISAGTQQAEACWEWLKELSDDRASLQDAFPARRSLADVDIVTAQTPPGTSEVYAAYRAALAGPPGAAPVDESQIDYYWFLRALDHALQGEDLQRELAEAQTTTEQFLACVRGGASGIVCAKQVDPGYQGWENTAPESH